MRKLTEILHDVAGQRGGYIMKDGRRVSGRISKSVVFYNRMIRFIPDVPEKVEDYLRRNGMLHSRKAEYINEARITLLRLSDGKQEVFDLTEIFLYFEGVSRERLRKIGSLGVDGKTVWCFDTEPEEYLKLARFLREAGVGFEYDAPPWVEVERTDIMNVKPSSERPGKDASRFLGYV